MIFSFKWHLSQWYEMLGDFLGQKSLLHCARREEGERKSHEPWHKVFLKSLHK